MPLFGPRLMNRDFWNFCWGRRTLNESGHEIKTSDVLVGIKAVSIYIFFATRYALNIVDQSRSCQVIHPNHMLLEAYRNLIKGNVD